MSDKVGEYKKIRKNYKQLTVQGQLLEEKD